MILSILSFSFFVIGFGLSYWMWIRPELRKRPQFADFYARTDSMWKAFWSKLNTIKTKLSAKLLMIGGGLVTIHDFLAPLIPGIDWTPLTAEVPAWVWPIASFALGALFLWLRNLTAQTQDKVVEEVAAGATVQEAKVVAGVEP